MRGRGGQKKSVFVHDQGIKNVHAGVGGVKKWQNSVHVVVECPLAQKSKKGASLDTVSKHAKIYA